MCLFIKQLRAESLIHGLLLRRVYGRNPEKESKDYNKDVYYNVDLKYNVLSSANMTSFKD